MKLLLDTHTLLWWAEDHARLGKRARKSIIAHGGFVSIVSAWELAIKVGIGKLRLALPVERFVREHIAYRARACRAGREHAIAPRRPF